MDQSYTGTDLIRPDLHACEAPAKQPEDGTERSVYAVRYCMSNEVRGSREVQLFFSSQPIIFLTWTGVSVGVFNKTAARLKRSALYLHVGTGNEIFPVPV